MLTNYSDLKTTVANYLGRTDLTGQIPSFIALAEIRLARELRIRQMLSTATASMTANDSTVGIPSDFLAMRDIFVEGTPRNVVNYVSPAAFTRNARTEEIGVPVFYTMRGQEFEFAPKPDADYTLQMLYYAKPAALSDTNPSNAFMATCPDALLYGALLEAEPYLMNDSRMATWSQMYSSAVARLTTSDDEAEFSGIPLTMTVV
jgi:hypothetical protein